MKGIIKRFLVVAYLLCPYIIFNYAHCSEVLAPTKVTEENDKLENIKKYSQFGVVGTSFLSFRDIPNFVQKYVKGKKTLDYGCGAGRSTRFLKSLGLEPIGVDISEKMLLQANRLDTKTHYFLIKSAKIPVMDKTYDLVFSSHVFLVISTKKEISKILGEINRVLKKDGILIIVTGSKEMHSKERKWLSYETDFPENTYLISGSLARLYIKEVNVTFYDYNWTDEDYETLFKQTGFKILEKHSPLGKKEEPYQWQSELQYSPYIIYVLRK